MCGRKKKKGLPDVVGSTEDHAAFGVARDADVRQPGVATAALEATVMPEAVQRVKQEALEDFASAAGTRPYASAATDDSSATQSGVHVNAHVRIGLLLRLLLLLHHPAVLLLLLLLLLHHDRNTGRRMLLLLLHRLHRLHVHHSVHGTRTEGHGRSCVSQNDNFEFIDTHIRAIISCNFIITSSLQ